MIKRTVAGLLACMALSIATPSAALDFPQALAMLKAGTDEAAIILQWSNSASIRINQEQAAELRAAGASEQLVAMLSISSRSASSEPQTAAEPATPVAAAPVPIVSREAPPALYDNQGWLAVDNADSTSYYLAASEGGKLLSLSKTPNGGQEIPSGTGITVALRREAYQLYGDSGRGLKVKIRRNRQTTLTLSPFGAAGDGGLRGTVQDENRVESEVLFGYVPPPVVIYREPVVVESAPVYVPHYAPYRFPRVYRGHYRW